MFLKIWQTSQESTLEYLFLIVLLKHRYFLVNFSEQLLPEIKERDQSNHFQIFFKIGVLKCFATFVGEHLLKLFNHCSYVRPSSSAISGKCKETELESQDIYSFGSNSGQFSNVNASRHVLT